MSFPVVFDDGAVVDVRFFWTRNEAPRVFHKIDGWNLVHRPEVNFDGLSYTFAKMLVMLCGVGKKPIRASGQVDVRGNDLTLLPISFAGEKLSLEGNEVVVAHDSMYLNDKPVDDNSVAEAIGHACGIELAFFLLEPLLVIVVEGGKELIKRTYSRRVSVERVRPPHLRAVKRSFVTPM